MSKKSSKKSQTKTPPQVPGQESPEVVELMLEIQYFRNCFDMIANGSHPGKQADIVLRAMQWIDKKILAIVEKLKPLAPHLFETKPAVKGPEPMPPQPLTVVPEAHTEQQL